MFPIAIGLGFLLGWGMDKLFHTSPWLTAIFTGLGVIAAFVNLFKIGLRG
jgi:F0F1-type ATP synthase assembly protein I